MQFYNNFPNAAPNVALSQQQNVNDVYQCLMNQMMLTTTTMPAVVQQPPLNTFQSTTTRNMAQINPNKPIFSDSEPLKPVATIVQQQPSKNSIFSQKSQLPQHNVVKPLVKNLDEFKPKPGS